MTTRQQAQELLMQLSENELQKVLQYMLSLTSASYIIQMASSSHSQGDHSISEKKEKSKPVDSQNGEALFKELMALREETLKYTFDDIETAREAVLMEKYGKYL